MKKTLLVLLLIPVLLLTGCFLFKNEAQTIVMEEMGLDISDAKVNFFLNTRKNDNGGITVIEAAFSDSAFAAQLESRTDFKSLPFSDALTKVLNSIDLLKDENGDLLIPYADNGYYRIELSLEDGKSLTEDQPADLIIAIYNGDNNKFHYCHLGISNINLISQLQSLTGAQ